MLNRDLPAQRIAAFDDRFVGLSKKKKSMMRTVYFLDFVEYISRAKNYAYRIAIDVCLCDGMLEKLKCETTNHKTLTSHFQQGLFNFRSRV